MSDPEPSPAEPLAGFQKKYLRGLAHDLKPLVHVGDAGLSKGVLEEVAKGLAAHELVKVRLQEPADKKSMAADLARSTGAHLCGLVGHTVTLYRAEPDEPSIELPERRAGEEPWRREQQLRRRF